MKVVLVSRYSMIPARPFSAPSPDCFTPPKGVCGCSVQMFTPTFPARRAALTRTARLTSFGLEHVFARRWMSMGQRVGRPVNPFVVDEHLATAGESLWPGVKGLKSPSRHKQ